MLLCICMVTLLLIDDCSGIELRLAVGYMDHSYLSCLLVFNLLGCKGYCTSQLCEFFCFFMVARVANLQIAILFY